MRTETRTPAGDLTFPHSEDPIIQARNNLRYWTDTWRRKNIGHAPDPAIVAAEFMVEALDNHYSEEAK
jgi:hypothetical protein